MPFTRPGKPARAVLVVVDGEVVGPDDMPGAAWDIRMPSFRFGPGDHLVEAYAVDEKGNRIVKLDGAVRFAVP